ncbi:MAG: ABC transporter permease [Defluviitaleaceae bacterium]|nr:ABC transporter permease [Defluviitaleaceae bacterium]
MSAFSAAYTGELSKLIKRKKYIVFIIIGLVICLLWALIGSALSGLIGRHGGFFISLAPTPMGALPFFLQVLIPLLIFMSITDLITTEGAEHTMKAILCRPVERWKLYSGKLLAVMTYVSIYLACVFIISTVLNQLLGRPLNLSEIFTAFISYMLTLPTLAVLATFAALVALVGRSATLTMLSLVALYLMMSILPIIFPIFGELLFTSYIGWYRLWIGARPAAPRLIHMLIIVIGYGTVFFIAGSLLFERKEY